MNIPASLTIALTCISMFAVPIPGLYNTGVDDSGTVLAGAEDDPHYSVVSGAAAKVITFPHPAWLPSTSESKWIWANATALPAGTFVFETSFDLTGFDLSTVSISGRWSTDNAGNDIIVNGTGTGQTSPSFAGWTGFSIPNGLLVAGINTIQFSVSDHGSPGAFRAEISGTGDLAVGVPEPMTTALALSVALVSLSLFRRGSLNPAGH